VSDLLTIHNLHVRLGGHEILHGIDAELERGRITALIGLNGSGTSTFLRALVKEVPYFGKITFRCGHDHTRPRPEYVGYVPQRLEMDANLPLTVYDLFGLALQRRPLFGGVSRRTRERIEALLRRVGVLHRLHAPVAKLSGGELQRVLLALALEPEPELLLLDEPAAGVDFHGVAPFYNLIAELNEKTGVTVLLVSHDVSMVSKVAHHIWCLRDGQIRCQGSPREILTGETLEQIFGSEQALYAHTHEHLGVESPESRVQSPEG
jgi:zinc transport system ATP-binding protein